MAERIEIIVGDSFAQKHEQLQAQLGDEYDATMRENVEDILHTLTKQLERSAEQQQKLQSSMENTTDASAAVSVDENVE